MGRWRLRTAALSKLCDLPARDLATATVAPDGTLHFIAGSHLYRVSG
ncbi:MAG TPA: hypothetical protein QGH10_20340 [Armatimonadota bacterium]|nr:hypothetical protein [Armatimonadota bacterium]